MVCRQISRKSTIVAGTHPGFTLCLAVAVGQTEFSGETKHLDAAKLGREQVVRGHVAGLLDEGPLGEQTAVQATICKEQIVNLCFGTL